MKASQTRRDARDPASQESRGSFRVGTGAVRLPSGGAPGRPEECPQCGRRRALWRENLGRGCPDDDGAVYCSQRCAGKVDRPD